MTSKTFRDPPERSVPDRFESFDLSIRRDGETYRARVVDSPKGPRQPVAIDAAGLAVEPVPAADGSEATRDVHRRPVDRENLRRVGEQLFRTVFVGSVMEAFYASVEKVRGAGLGLRICLLLDEASELAALPWEALWDPKDRAFLADQPDLPVVRALRVAAEAPVVAALATPPLRLLAMLPEPRGENKLGGAAEWRQIRETLEPYLAAGEVQAELLEPPTLRELGDRIHREPCHVLHIVAHGGQGDPGAGGQLNFEDAAGELDAVSGISLTRALERRNPPRLVVVSACHGARAAADDAFDGMAQHLLSRGVPAVVAMRTAITDAAAVAFSAALYQHLARGRTVEAAVVEARRVLSLGERHERRAEWATPALYMRGANIRIFEAGLVVPTPLMSQAGERRRQGLRRGSVAVAAAGLLAALAWAVLKLPPGESDLCSAPFGLQDLEFVRIEPDVVNLEDRNLTVENAFCISTKEVSRRDWREVMNMELPRPDWHDDWPMTNVRIEDANAFMKQLEARDLGVSYRLPTADEWEFAARAGQTTDYFFGDDSVELHRFGNCRNYLGQDCADGPAPIDSYSPNAWGLYNVHGNVAEWVQWPEDAGPSLGEEGYELALRLGGSFNTAPSGCAFSSRGSKVKADDRTREDTGFRVVRDLSQEEAEGN